jgi:hypothetical protein
MIIRVTNGRSNGTPERRQKYPSPAMQNTGSSTAATWAITGRGLGEWG